MVLNHDQNHYRVADFQVYQAYYNLAPRDVQR
nr:MAG TPA: hypothetical protein [Caudoviricetes sp.]